jgi:cytochrome c-type biogenesis protein CcmF
MDMYVHFGRLIIKSKDSISTEIMVKQTDPRMDFILIKALAFPYINVLWLGVLVMVFGFFISLGDLLSRVSGSKFPEAKEPLK